MKETKWINLSQEQIAPASAPSDAKWTLESPSVYDIPSHVRALYDPSKGTVCIEFRYIESEPTDEIKLSEYCKAYVGKRSHRIWSVDFDIHGYNRDQKRIAQALEESIESVASAKAESRVITSRAISLNRMNLLGSKELCI